MFLRIYFPVFAVLLSLGLFSHEHTGKRPGKPLTDSISSFRENFYPEKKKTDQVVKHMAYMLCYNEKYEQASWVAYHLTAEMCAKGGEERTDNFREDKEVMTGSATPDDY